MVSLRTHYPAARVPPTVKMDSRMSGVIMALLDINWGPKSVLRVSEILNVLPIILTHRTDKFPRVKPVHFKDYIYRILFLTKGGGGIQKRMGYIAFILSGRFFIFWSTSAFRENCHLDMLDLIRSWYLNIYNILISLVMFLDFL